ncbi:nitrate- and nitrite sensing domain-containing protein [Streptomyces mexicanus]|uniref:nitrate- and nitrite sensing domain-containing protein n=1 Tax=Streptomyces mexicanus TaxID=178566 RepID=UPI00364BFA57
MRFRGKSIRRKIVALLLVPLLSLTAVWAFATVITGRQAARLFDTSSVVEKVAYPTEDTVRVLQQERRQSLVLLADPRASDSLAALRRSRTATDEAVARLRRNAKDTRVRDALGSGGTGRLTAVLDALDGIDALRRSVEDRTVDRAQALDLYNRLVGPCYDLLAGLHVTDDANLNQQYHALVDLGRARELLSREDALLGSALVVGTLTRDESRAVAELVAQRSLLYDVSLPLLPASERGRYQRFWANATSAPLRAAEQAAAATTSGLPREVTAKSWDTAAADALKDLAALDDHAEDRYQDRVHPVAMRVITKAAVAGVLGLLALLISLLLSVRIGRDLVRDLKRLRREAHEAAGVRLPGVMRRLSAGEQVDVETEVPRLAYDKNEIGEVGQALNTLQRAAVEAAVKQAELRAGVSEVFVNLARRSQVLLHKQLTLLDAMERRTEDTEELADLFRLDHLTTRMRRHAEGLVILSGAAPSRQWRKPVQLMDVVRAAVAEVEDYERIEVRRLPRVALTGPAVADLTHLIAELLENATVFSPPHTAVQVLGERVANGFTLEIHDRGLGMTAEALLDANLRLAETPEFELSDTDRLGLFVVSRLAQRQNVRVSLQPSPYGGTTAIVFIPDALLTDDVPDTNGVGFRLDRPRLTGKAEREENRGAALAETPVRLPGLPVSLLDGPVELEAPVDLDAVAEWHPAVLGDEDGEDGGLFRPRRAPARPQPDRAGPRSPAEDRRGSGLDGASEGTTDDEGLDLPVPLPRRRTPKLVSSHGRPVREKPERPETSEKSGEPGKGGQAATPAKAERTEQAGQAGQPGRGLSAADVPPAGGGEPEPGPPAPLPRRRRGSASLRPAVPLQDTPQDPGAAPSPPPADSGPQQPPALARRVRPAALDAGSRGGEGPDGDGPSRTAASGEPAPDTRPLPRRVRQANLAPQLKQAPKRRTGHRADPAERDAEQVRSRMSSLQRGWQRGREENAADDDARDSAPGTTKGDGR